MAPVWQSAKGFPLRLYGDRWGGNPPSHSSGVMGASESAMDVSSSNREAVSSLKNECSNTGLEILSLSMSLEERFDINFCGRFSGSGVSTAESMDGNPNSIISSNFCGDAKYTRSFSRASGS